jgi:F0F1-type ATP synthase membrane subunit b/b'
MNINATIFIQIINFGIVYWLLRNLLFRPVVNVIDHELLDRSALVTLVEQQKKSIEIQEKERERYWNACREYCKSHQPDTVRQIYFTIAKQEREVASLPHIEKMLIEDVYKKLEEKIKHVH